MRRLGRDALVGEALTVLAGNPAASMLDLSQGIGVGRTTLYRHFGDREALVAEVARLGARMFIDAFMRARPDEGQGLAAVERICAELFTVPDVLTLLFADNPIITDDHFAEVAQQGRTEAAATASAVGSGGASDLKGTDDGDPLERVIARGQSDGSIASDVPVEWAAAYVFLTVGAGHLFSVGSGKADSSGRARALELTIRAVEKTLSP
ncbi:TetR/AcrR family transcriptional regulator [Brevibacterium atlanticum]|uniref:TetR/AcrR family transcriptional regulator n=1 Tax=Brevibacterium atlanticum TaxID=2697563 RepID=UPI001422E3E2|nr:TetR/AcrR family transcriptional regulator [Brevibacterium atlanticum]